MRVRHTTSQGSSAFDFAVAYLFGVVCCNFRTMGHPVKGHGRGNVVLFGMDLAGMSEGRLLTVLALGAIGCAVAFSYLQEKSFRVEGALYARALIYACPVPLGSLRQCHNLVVWCQV